MNRFGKFVSLLLLPLIAIVVGSALKAYVLKSPPAWTFEMTIFIFGSFFMLGSAYCHEMKGHVAVDVITNYLPEKARRYQSLFAEAIVLLVTLLVVYVAVPNAWRATLMGERSILQTPFNPYVWWFRWIIPISAGLIACQCLRHLAATLGNQK